MLVMEVLSLSISPSLPLVQDLLADPAPVIRTMGVTGICRVLGIYWELIPSATLQTLLKRLIKDMSCDMSSSAVRASVFHVSWLHWFPSSHALCKFPWICNHARAVLFQALQ